MRRFFAGSNFAALRWTAAVGKPIVRKLHHLMIILITLVHVFVCFFLIIVVLLQSGKSGDIAAAFGGQGSQTAFGPRGAATVLTKTTTWCAVIFMLTSITLSIAASKKGGPKSVLQGVKTTTNAPAKPANPPASPQK